jgi:hypothetical protein
MSIDLILCKEAVRSTVLIHCVYKAGGWQPKAAGGWFTLLTLPHKPDSYSNDSNYIYRIEAHKHCL